MRPFIAIDPGPTQSAIVQFPANNPLPAPATGQFLTGIYENDEILRFLQAVACSDHTPTLVIEMIASYGMPVGASVFETCVWIGRFQQTFLWRQPAARRRGIEVVLMKRLEVKMHLCHSARAKDSNINAALWDLYGGSQRAAKGTKKNPGPCYGFKEDLWAALAVGRTWYDRQLAQSQSSPQSIAPVEILPTPS